MKVLVTGATGFIGNYVVAELLKNKCEVIASSVQVKKAKGFNWYNEVEYIPLNLAELNDDINLFQFFHCPDKVIHMAWEGLPNYKSSFHLEVNLPRHFTFLNNLILHGLKDLTITGTCFEYGMQEGRLNENMPSMPDNPYAIAKNELRKALETLHRENTFSLKWLRLFYMFGKGQNPNSLFSQLEAAILKGDKVFNMSGGKQERDYLPVEKVAEYIVNASMQDKVTGIINCCSGEPVSIKQLVKNYLHKKHISMQLNLGYYPYTDYEPMSFWGDNSKLNSLF